jgi:chemotaxis protein MotB
MGVEDLLNQNGPAEEVEEGAPAWMATFADMATLLMTFFVLLLSFANMDAQKFNEMLGSVKDAFGVQKETFGQYRALSDSMISAEVQREIEAQMQAAADAQGKAASQSMQSGADAMMQMEQAMSIIESLFESLEGVADVFMDENGITVRVKGGLLFASGEAELRPESAPVMERVAALLTKYTFDLYILGHTDSVPIRTSRYPSNWELSSARATAALRQLAERGANPQRLVAVGFADSRPIASNDTPEGRERNRRVEFLFKNPESLPGGGFQPANPG